MGGFELASVAALATCVACAAFLRGRFYAVYSLVLLGAFTAISSSQQASLALGGPLPLYLQAVVYLSFLMLVWPRMRSRAYRALVSIPAAFYLGATILALPWALVRAFGVEPPWPLLPYAVAAVGLVESLWARESEVDVVLDGNDAGDLRRYRGGEPTGRVLHLIQITDPHLGPFMSVRRLRRICARAVERSPDLILLTGDFLTMESRATEDALRRALEPLSVLRGRVFACLGNHDHEAPELVASALSTHGIELLVDHAVVCETPAGSVQIVGFDHRWSGRRQAMARVCAEHPRIDGTPRIALLHDPAAFSRLAPGEADLVLSGHTHGGQLGLLTLGLPWTFLSVFSRIPDHGLWARGAERLYVHRGTGHYGFPLRVGVPAEQSLLRVHVPLQEG